MRHSGERWRVDSAAGHGDEASQPTPKNLRPLLKRREDASIDKQRDDTSGWETLVWYRLLEDGGLRPPTHGHLFHQRNRPASLACIWHYLCLELEDQTGTSATC